MPPITSTGSASCTYGDNFPIFPFYTANQYDQTAYNIGGSNNFSNINFTVQYRAVRSALRHYDPEQQVHHPGVRRTPSAVDGVEHLPRR